MITLHMFSNVNTGTIVMAVLAVLIAAYLLYLERKEKSDPTVALCKQYETLTVERLAAIPDEELLTAVTANLLGKQDRRHPDLSVTLPLLSPGRCGVYSVWLVCHELEKGELGAFFGSPSRRFGELAATGFDLVGADACAAAMQAAVEAYVTHPKKQRGQVPWDTLTVQLRQAVEAEHPLGLCVQYIRDNPEQFADA